MPIFTTNSFFCFTNVYYLLRSMEEKAINVLNILMKHNELNPKADATADADGNKNTTQIEKQQQPQQDKGGVGKPQLGRQIDIVIIFSLIFFLFFLSYPFLPSRSTPSLLLYHPLLCHQFFHSFPFIPLPSLPSSLSCHFPSLSFAFFS